MGGERGKNESTNLTASKRNLRLIKLDMFVLLENLGEAAATHKLHHDPELITNDVAINVLNNVGVMRGLHDTDFGDDELGAAM